MWQFTRSPIIDFTNYITERTLNFTGRKWVFQSINDWLGDPNGSRAFLLQGEPGSGKTAIAARLNQFSRGLHPPDGLTYLTSNFLSAVHFCSANDNRWVDPLIFAGSLATQLANRYPAYLEMLQNVQQNQHIQINVIQNVQKVENGQVTGVIINVNASSPESVFNRVVRDPLEALLDKMVNQQIVILVDALDEALSYSGDVKIISLLSNNSNLPSKVRFILTCRQDTRVENEFPDRESLVLSGFKYNQRNQRDICLYIQRRLSKDKELVAKAVQIDSAYVSKLIEVVPHRAEGNFLYVRFLLDAMAKGHRSLTDLEGLPEGLDELYFDSLKRVIKLGKRDWASEYAPLLGILSVAQESLTLAQLQAFTPHIHTKFSIWQYLGDLQPFLEEWNSQEEQVTRDTKYHLYHQSFADFLHRQSLSNTKRQSRNDFYLPAEECHKILIDGCERGGLTIIWDNIKRNPSEKGRCEYTKQYYATHLYLSEEWDKLFTLLDEEFYRLAKIKYSVHSYAQDLNLGRQASTREGLTLSEGILLLPHLWRYTLLHCSLTSQANNYSLEKFEALMLLQREQEALGLAELLTDTYSQARAMLLIAYLLRMNSNKIQVSLQLLMRVQHIAVSIKDSKNKAEVLAILVHELAEMHLWQQAINIADTIGSSEFRVGAMIAIGNALGRAKYWKLAKDTLIKTKYIIYTVDDIDTKTEAMAELGKAWAHIHQWKQVKNIICTLNNSWLKTNVLVELGKALRHVGQNKQAENVWAEAERITQTIENPCDKAFMLGILSCELVETLYKERANSLWKEALHTAQNIEDIWDKSQILIELGDMFAQAQYLDRANIVLTEATKALGAIDESRVNDIERAALQGELGKAWAHAHEWERAKFIANDIGYIPTDRAMIDLSGTSKIRAQVLVELGNMMAQMGLQEHAKRLWVEVLPTRFLEWHEDRKWLLESLEMTFRQLHQSQLAEITAQMIDDTLSKEDILAQLGKEGAMFPEEGVSEPIETSSVNTDMLDKLCDIWIQTENLRRVENTISEYKKERRIENTISEEDESEERRYKIEILCKMAEALAKSGKNDYLLHLVQKIWLQAEEIYDADNLIPLATNLISLEPQVGISFCNAFILVDTFLKDGRI